MTRKRTDRSGKRTRGPRVLFSNYYGMGKGGGGETNTLELARALLQKGTRVTIATAGTFPWPDTVRFDKHKLPTLGFQTGYLARFLERTIREKEIDVVHAMDRLTSAAAVTAAKRTQTPVVVHFNDHWLICLKSTGVDQEGKKRKDWSIGRVWRELPKHRFPWEAYRLGALKKARRIIRDADAFVCVGQQLAENLAHALPQGKTHVVNNPIDLPRFAKARPDPRFVCMGKKRMGYSGRLAEEKGALLLPEIASKVFEREKDAVLLVAGTGPCEAEMRRQVKEKGIGERVRFLECLAQEKMPSFYRSIDVLLAPSQLEEPFGLSPAEALAAGTCVVASDAGEFRNMIVDGKNGYRAPPTDTEAWAQKTLLALRKSKAMRTQAKKSVQKYAPKRAAQKLEAIYRAVRNKRSQK